jgi:hypothetical protein
VASHSSSSNKDSLPEDVTILAVQEGGGEPDACLASHCTAAAPACSPSLML